MFNISAAPSPENLSFAQEIDLQPDVFRDIPEDPSSFTETVVIPTIACFGILGNLLNLTLLSWRCKKKEVDFLERGALIGLIALSASDFCFCVVTIPQTVFTSQTIVFPSRCIQMYYKMYGVYLHEVFIKISTWLTVVISTARYMTVCHPLKTRVFVRLFSIKVAIVMTFTFWPLCLLPYIWHYKVTEFYFHNTTVYVLDLGAFDMNHTLKTFFVYFWAIIGYFVPVAILTFCNVCLIRALQASRRFQLSSSTLAYTRSSRRNISMRITLTLVLLVLMFLVLVSPSVLMNFVARVAPEIFDSFFQYAIVVGNTLQTLNFACHFVLYCLINFTFRRMLASLICSLMSRFRKTCQTSNTGATRLRKNSLQALQHSSSGNRPTPSLKHVNTMM